MKVKSLLADANFGMLPDLEIADLLNEARARYGYPKFVHYSPGEEQSRANGGNRHEIRGQRYFPGAHLRRPARTWRCWPPPTGRHIGR